MTYVSRVHQLGADLKSMDVTISGQEVSMVLLCVLPSRFKQLVVAIEVVADDEKLTIDFLKSILPHEEQLTSDILDGEPLCTRC